MEETGGRSSIFRYFLLLFLPTVALIAVILYYNHHSDVSRTKAAAVDIERAHLATLSRALSEELFHPILTDLLTLAEDPRMTALLDNRSAETLAGLGETMVGFARNKIVYDQIRYIDVNGLEVVRVNHLGRSASLVKTADLQNKSGRYYFEETLKQLRRGVYVSPFDLNVERGYVERPLKPMIRIGTPVFDSQGVKRGILLFNYLGQEVLDIVASHNQSRRQMMLINPDGYWIKGPSADQEWGFMLAERRDFSFEQRYPHAWSGVRDNPESQQFLSTGLFSSLVIDPFLSTDSIAVDSAQSWTLISLLPRESLMGAPTQNLPNRLMIGAVLILLAFAAALTLSRTIAQRSQALAQLEKASARKQLLIDQLRQAQGQLVQAEKMAGIGQLAAGVAHEINNPVGFVGGNINSLYGYTEALLKIVDALDSQIASADDIEQVRKEVARIKQQYELDYLREDIVPLLAETRDGIDRIKRIVADLKGFARASNESWEPVDLHREIERTLNLVWNELKYHCTVEKQFGDVPEVECIVSEINQVILNLLLNASQAIETQGVITIRTGASGGSAWIEIEDDGKGIAEAEQNRIFEPFFTTKPVGKGTGLGLSISYGIIKKHRGRLEVSSTEGHGALFRITLPVTQDERVSEANATTA